MLLPIDQLIDLPVMSLQTGTELARTTGVVVDPREMKIAAFYVEGSSLETQPSILHPEDIRELSDIGFIVDDSDRLMSMDGLVRLQAVIDLHFELHGMKVIDQDKRKLGKVADYVVEPDGFTIQQLNVQQSLLRSLSNAVRIIRRTQVVAVKKDVIVVKNTAIQNEQREAATQSAQAFANPFRSSQPESSSRQPR